MGLALPIRSRSSLEPGNMQLTSGFSTLAGGCFFNGNSEKYMESIWGFCLNLGRCDFAFVESCGRSIQFSRLWLPGTLLDILFHRSGQLCILHAIPGNAISYFIKGGIGHTKLKNLRRRPSNSTRTVRSLNQFPPCHHPAISTF